MLKLSKCTSLCLLSFYKASSAIVGGAIFMISSNLNYSPNIPCPGQLLLQLLWQLSDKCSLKEGKLLLGLELEGSACRGRENMRIGTSLPMVARV